MKSSFKGYFYGIATSMTFGLIPLFTLPVLGKGVGYESILFHRFLFATLALGLMIIVKGESFRIKPRRELPTLVLLALFYTASSLFLLLGYNYMGAGVATTIHFTYPLMVSFIMFSIFKERTDWILWTAILLAVAGVAILSLGDGGTLKFEMKGLIIVLLSAVGYASYICGVNKSRLKTMNGRKLAFYVFLFTTLIITVQNIADGEIEPLPDLSSYIYMMLLAILPTVVSNITLVLAVQNIGGTMTSVLGALEPLTAVCIGVLVFGEPFAFSDAAGIILILSAVTAVILSGSIKSSISTVVKKIRPRHA